MFKLKKINLFLSVLFIFTFSDSAFARSIKIKTISSQDIVEKIESRKGEKQGLLIYASWCPNCRAVMPMVLDIEKKIPGFFTAVSMDKSSSKLKKYLKNQKPSFVPFKWDQKVNLAQSLKPLGVEFNNKIPFFVIFNSKGEITSQGNMKPDQL